METLKTRIKVELRKINENSSYENDEIENSIFEDIKQLTGWSPTDNDEDNEYILGANNEERYRFALRKIESLQSPKSDEEVIAEITAKIKESCTVSRYYNLCQRIQNTGGLDYVINRCINMMAKDKVHLSTALATLESEEEGIN